MTYLHLVMQVLASTHVDHRRITGLIHLVLLGLYNMLRSIGSIDHSYPLVSPFVMFGFTGNTGSPDGIIQLTESICYLYAIMRCWIRLHLDILTTCVFATHSCDEEEYNGSHHLISSEPRYHHGQPSAPVPYHLRMPRR